MASFWGKLADEDDLDPMADQLTFATAENVGSCCKYLLNSLAGLGMSDQLKLGSSNPEDLAGVCNCLYALIQQRQADRDTQERLEGLATKMRMDAQASSSERTRLEAQLQEKFTELGSLEIKLRTMQQKHRTDSDAWGKQADTLNLRCKQAERREQQLETKLRQQVAEAEGLRAKLRAALQGKGNRAGSHGTLPAEDSAEGVPSFSDTAPAALGGTASNRNNRNRVGGGCNSNIAAASTAAAQCGSGIGGGRNARSMSATALTVGGAEDVQLQKLLEATESRAASLGHENVKLREQLHDMRTEFEQLLSRCESLGVGAASAEQSALPANAADKPDARRPTNTSRPQHPHQQQHHQKHHHHHHRSHHTAAAETMGSEELSSYLATELKSVQGRCRALLDGLAAKKASRSTPPSPAPNSNSQQQQQQASGDHWAIAAVEAEMQEQLDDAQAVLQEQEKGLARALVALHRAEAQRSAAQQRASAAQLRSVQLEKQLTAATQEQLASGERLMELRATVYDLEAQVAKLKQLLAVREKELQHALAMQQQQQQQQQELIAAPAAPSAAPQNEAPKWGWLWLRWGQRCHAGPTAPGPGCS
uniref:Uncharacterized protein n=1 Tax=Dunaliella tertiolecta TaxID=3047 RepID=A0A7S3R617_DUNTE